MQCMCVCIIPLEGYNSLSLSSVKRLARTPVGLTSYETYSPWAQPNTKPRRLWMPRRLWVWRVARPIIPDLLSLVLDKH